MQNDKQPSNSKFDAAFTTENHLDTSAETMAASTDTHPRSAPSTNDAAQNHAKASSAAASSSAASSPEALSVLLVTGIEGAENCANAMAALLGSGTSIAVAANRREALAALRKREFSVLVVEESLAECDPSGAEQLWRSAGGAMPIQVNFALSGTSRIAREIHAAASRREREQIRARHAAVIAMEQDLRTTIAGLLLHSELALASSREAPHLAERLRTVVDLAGSLRQQLGGVPSGS